MTERVPPKLALWLLKHGSSGYHREALEGDLFELFQQEGRSRAWYWRQVAAAIWSARGAGAMFRRRRAKAVVNALMLIFGALALGAGAFAWANSVRSDACRAAACVCPNH